MIENKFFNNSATTSAGKPKFMPPQKRQMLTDDPLQIKPQQSHTNETTPQNLKNNITIQFSKSEEKKPHAFSFKRYLQDLEGLHNSIIGIVRYLRHYGAQDI